MNIYFVASPRASHELQKNYQSIYDQIKKLGHTHTSDYIVSVDVNEFYKIPKSLQVAHYKQSIHDLAKADLAVFEVSVPSLAIGQLIQQAIILNKPVIALYTDPSYPLFLAGAEEVEAKVQVVKYTQENLSIELRAAIEYSADWLESRFTLIIPSSIKNHLDRIAKKGISRSDYIRSLIENDIHNNS